MKDTASLIEYGAAIDPQTMVTPPDVTELELEPGHPGLGDEEYVRRRKELFAICRKHRLEQLGPPLIDYNAEETRIWRLVSPKLDELHVQYACDIYLKAKRDLAITRDEIPQLRQPPMQLVQLPDGTIIARDHDGRTRCPDRALESCK